MTTHAEHDHPNTKAARAACRKALEGSISRHPAKGEPGARLKAVPGEGKAAKPKKQPKPKITQAVNTSLPHEFDEDAERPGFCYVCRLTKRARVHDEGPTDLTKLFKL